MKDDDSFNFEDDFESSSDEMLKESKDDSDLLAGNELDQEPEMDEAEPAQVKKSSGLMSFLKANIIFIVIGLAVVGLAGYMSYGIMFPSSGNPAPAQSQQPKGFGLKPVVPEPAASSAGNTANQNAATAAQTKTASGAMNAQPAPISTLSQSAAPATITMTQQDMKTLMEGFAKIVQQNSQSLYSQMQNISVLTQEVGQASLAEQKQTEQVTAALNNMQQSMNTLTTDIAIYNKNMMLVGKELDKTQQQLALLLAEQSAQVQKLTLRAVVPGRAWLVDGQGNTTTVTVGSELPNYGTVVNIDSGKGEVIMSTGYVFK